ncbi:hypothetical protein A1359_07990 [Methylomonas lenta]|uniref:Uncharacterized protein n=1 Tax=Methylomonas lenta TaxID=980561 RepID=A0A177NG25_9GAMM|nr:hypothetical protein [Methylomonas lenta]OAI16574.1 hypothetical protein A1359_07990 [Methylomonas lenta]
MNNHQVKTLFAALAVTVALIPTSASAISLSAATGGTFTFNLDSAALGNYVGGSASGTNNYYLSSFANTAASDPTVVTTAAFSSTIDATQISATNLVHDLTSVGTDPTGQASGRHVKATTAGFSIDSSTLAGVAGEKLGMTGMQGFYIPDFGGNPSKMYTADFSLQFDFNRASNVTSASGWYLNNNAGFTLDTYDLANLNVTVDDANNWLLTGDLLMAPGLAGMLMGPSYTDVGGFQLGVGSYATSPVPVPAAAWLFGGGLLSLLGAVRKKSVVSA